ncbi:outer membrane beta-barrel protein [Dyadobacter sp. 3J3]|uniref:outer membrane beta-barrel protein n=1 Tax=Dyadobacter sp. 3J3 TaxID=2606600 RepID=UPI0013589EDF|nr:outer membrane beta-barrel protein [Dyadobacter sp. 3J3]
MKNLFFLSLLLLLNSACFAQNDNTLFLTYALSNPEPVYNGDVVGGAGYKPVASSSFGIRYLMKSTKIITIETGIEYSNYHFKLDYVDNPDVTIPYNQKTAKLISIPVYAHLTFLRYLFINGGALIDTEIDKKENDINKQSGIGFGLGAGLKYKFRNVSIFVNPFLERHAFIGIAGSHQGSRRSMINSGGRVGIGYSF